MSQVPSTSFALPSMPKRPTAIAGIQWIAGAGIISLGALAGAVAASHQTAGAIIAATVGTAMIGVVGIVLVQRTSGSSGRYGGLPPGIPVPLQPKVARILEFYQRVGESRVDLVIERAQRKADDFLSEIAELDKFTFSVKGTEAVDLLEEILRSCEGTIFTSLTPGLAVEIDPTIGQFLRTPHAADGAAKPTIVKVLRLERESTPSPSIIAIAYADASVNIRVKATNKENAERIHTREHAANFLMVEGKRCGKVLALFSSEGNGTIYAHVSFDNKDQWDSYMAYRAQLESRSTTLCVSNPTMSAADAAATAQTPNARGGSEISVGITAPHEVSASA
ncbi:MAG: hypothetical protein JNM86_00100 [Phycisphaerae bacterium]|nr:hypothetical protein [Phycisphaerae bacterium]